MRVLVFGGYGQLGTAIRRAWSGDALVAPSRAQADILDERAVDAVLESARPELVVNCAAFHDVDACEAQPASAFAANAYAVHRLARLCAQREAAFLTLSTDYVFDGTAKRPYCESDTPGPLSAYGASKYAGEVLARLANPRTYVVRSCGLYGPAERRDKPSFVDRVIERSRRGETVEIDPRIVASPTFTGHLAPALRALVDTGRYGLYHAANASPVSWLDFARAAVAYAGIENAPRAGEPLERRAPRPLFSALDSSLLGSIGIVMPDWRSALREYVAADGAQRPQTTV